VFRQLEVTTHDENLSQLRLVDKRNEESMIRILEIRILELPCIRQALHGDLWIMMRITFQYMETVAPHDRQARRFCTRLYLFHPASYPLQSRSASRRIVLARQVSSCMSVDISVNAYIDG